MPRLRNEKYERFCRFYTTHWNMRRAAEEAGFGPNHGTHLLDMPQVSARVVELSEMTLKAADITAQRVMLELGRVAFSDIRKVFNPDGTLMAVHEMDDDAAASIAGIEHETHSKVSQEPVLNLETGEMELQTVVSRVRTAKIKRFNKDAALTTLAKHFKIVGDEGDGVNALASALADRLKTARKRIVKDEAP